MSITVRIPTVLRRLTSGQDEIAAQGVTVADVLSDIGKDNAEFLQRITTETGELRPFLNVFVNGDDIRFAQDLRTTVSDGDEISIVPSIAGG